LSAPSHLFNLSLCASSFSSSESGALFALEPRLGFGPARRGSKRFLSEMEIQGDALGQASPRTRSGSFFAVDHPRNSELIGKHPKAGGPESLLERHPHRSFFGGHVFLVGMTVSLRRTKCGRQDTCLADFGARRFCFPALQLASPRFRPARCKDLKVAFGSSADWAKRPRSGGTEILLKVRAIARP
jgi:hypothetical protein